MFGRRRGVLRKYLRRSFVVTQLDGTMFQGALMDWDSATLEFARVKVYDPATQKYVPAAEGPYVVERPMQCMQRVSVVDVAEQR